MLLGHIIEALDGHPYEASLQARILDPLGLTETHILRPHQPDPALVAGHVNGEPVQGADYASPYSAAPVSTTAGDLIRWWRALLSGAVVSEESLAVMTEAGWPIFGNEHMSYGRGVQLSHMDTGPGAMLMHSGGIVGFTASVAWLPEHDVFAAVLVSEQSVPAEAALWRLVQSTYDPAVEN